MSERQYWRFASRLSQMEVLEHFLSIRLIHTRRLQDAHYGYHEEDGQPMFLDCLHHGMRAEAGVEDNVDADQKPVE